MNGLLASEPIAPTPLTVYETHANLPPPNQFLTYDKDDLKHLVKDEVLDLLELQMTHSKVDFEQNVFYWSLGAAFGLIIPAAQGIWEYCLSADGFNVIDILTISLCTATAALSAVMLYICKNRPKKSKDIIKEIRERTILMLQKAKQNESTKSPNRK